MLFLNLLVKCEKGKETIEESQNYSVWFCSVAALQTRHQTSCNTLQMPGLIQPELVKKNNFTFIKRLSSETHFKIYELCTSMTAQLQSPYSTCSKVNGWGD